MSGVSRRICESVCVFFFHFAKCKYYETSSYSDKKEMKKQQQCDIYIFKGG